MGRKRPKRLFFFGGDFGFLDFTIFRFHLSGDFSTGGGRWGRKAGQLLDEITARKDSGGEDANPKGPR